MVKIPALSWFENFSQRSGAQNGSINRSDRSRLDAIRSLDFASYSDADLRDAITGPAAQANGPECEDTISQVFAIVNEAIGRRQGAWRFFDPAIVDHRLLSVHTHADDLFENDEYKIDRKSVV